MREPGHPLYGTLFERSARLLEGLGLCQTTEIIEAVPLAGGVASDIARVRFRDRVVCIKFALERLRVEQDWRAPLHRGRAEYAWLTVAQGVRPGIVPALHGWSDAQGGFAMEYIAGPGVYLWKAALLAEEPDRGEAARVADALGAIHAASTRPGFDAGPFRNAPDFEMLRLDPYLRHTARRHPDLAAPLVAMADALGRQGRVLVHGDVSPKNILLREGRPVLLDAECATMGDGVFDVAFCLNHLALKAIHLPGSRGRLLRAFLDFWAAYRPHLRWEDAAAFETRVARLFPMLMLARVDGKSPVEYLTPAGQAQVRTQARALIARPAAQLVAVAAALAGDVP